MTISVKAPRTLLVKFLTSTKHPSDWRSCLLGNSRVRIAGLAHALTVWVPTLLPAQEAGPRVEAGVSYGTYVRDGLGDGAIGGFARVRLAHWKWAAVVLEGAYQPLNSSFTQERRQTLLPVPQLADFTGKEARRSISGSLSLRGITGSGSAYFRIGGSLARVRRTFSLTKRDTTGVLLAESSGKVDGTGIGIDGGFGFRIIQLRRVSVALEARANLAFLPSGGGTFPTVGLGLVLGL